MHTLDLGHQQDLSPLDHFITFLRSRTRGLRIHPRCLQACDHGLCQALGVGQVAEETITPGRDAGIVGLAQIGSITQGQVHRTDRDQLPLHI